MCWSWEVSLAFSLLQWAIIGYMFQRNVLLDRVHIAFSCIIATQETIQFLLWAFVLPDESNTADQCSSLNIVLSYLLLIIVETMPIGLLGGEQFHFKGITTHLYYHFGFLKTTFIVTYTVHRSHYLA